MRNDEVEEIKETQGDVSVVIKTKLAVKAPKGKVGRKTVDDKKKARQVFFNDSEYAVIEEVFEEFLSLTPKTAMEKAVKDLFKKVTGVTLKEVTDTKKKDENKEILHIVKELKDKKNTTITIEEIKNRKEYK